MERILRLPNDSVIKDQKQIDAFLEERRRLNQKKDSVSPTQILKDIDLTQVTLERVDRRAEAVLELRGSKEARPFNNILYQAADLEIELSPEEDVDFQTPRKIMCFKLTSDGKELIIETYFDETEGEYWEHYSDKKRVEELVKRNLNEALKAKNWKQDGFGVWFVAK